MLFPIILFLGAFSQGNSIYKYFQIPIGTIGEQHLNNPQAVFLIKLGDMVYPGGLGRTKPPLYLEPTHSLYRLTILWEEKREFWGCRSQLSKKFKTLKKKKPTKTNKQNSETNLTGSICWTLGINTPQSSWNLQWCSVNGN